MLGYRESSLYGLKTLAEIEASLEDMIRPKDLKLRAFQSNSEGKIISYLQEAYIKDFESKVETVPLIVNLAAYTHTSLAIFDSLWILG